MIRFEQGLSRRGFLEGGATLAALMMPQALTPSTGEASVTRSRRRAKSVIVLLLEGGMSHIDTWDPKPNASLEVRGEFGTIATSNPELRIGEHMPLLAQQAHRYNVIRSLYSTATNHSPGLHWVLTGYDNRSAGVNNETVNRAPSVGSIVSHELGGATPGGLPNFVAVPSRQQLGGRVNFTDSKYLGATHEAFESGPTPNTAAERYAIPAGLTLSGKMSARRLADRQYLLASLDALRRARGRGADMRSMTDFQHQAIDVLLGGRGRVAFDINQEPRSVRERYGSTRNGQATLLARRLVEAGVSYVLVNYSINNSWDTHRNNFASLKGRLLPPMDRAVSTLLVDLDERGLLDDTLVVMLGEMGRTPVVNKQSGRDHWPNVYSAMIAGGGTTRGQVLGTSASFGDEPRTRPVHLDELLATVYQQLGIDPETTIEDSRGRPTRILPAAEPVKELIGV